MKKSITRRFLLLLSFAIAPAAFVQSSPAPEDAKTIPQYVPDIQKICVNIDNSLARYSVVVLPINLPAEGGQGNQATVYRAQSEIRKITTGGSEKTAQRSQRERYFWNGQLTCVVLNESFLDKERKAVKRNFRCFFSNGKLQRAYEMNGRLLLMSTKDMPQLEQEILTSTRELLEVIRRHKSSTRSNTK